MTPPSGRRVLTPYNIKGVGGWAPWRSLRTGLDGTGCLQGGPRSGYHGGAGDSGCHGETASEAAAPSPRPGLYEQSHTTPPPQKKYLGKLTGLNLGTGALRGVNLGTGALRGLNWGAGACTRLWSGAGANTGASSGAGADTGASSGLEWAATGGLDFGAAGRLERASASGLDLGFVNTSDLIWTLPVCCCCVFWVWAPSSQFFIVYFLS